MAICKFYATGFCRYGDKCRFQHIDNTANYYQRNYNRNDYRNDNRQPTQSSSTSNKVGFSFNRTLDNISTRSPVQPSVFGGSAMHRPNESQMPSLSRNTFQFARGSSSQPQTGSTGGSFSFNRTLQNLNPSGNDRQPVRSSVNDIEMDSSGHPISHINVGPREPQTTPFGLFSQTNTNLFGNKSSITKSETFGNKTPVSTQSSSSTLRANDEIYSKSSELTENDIKQFKAVVFTFKSIPICPPTQELCF